MNLGIGIDSALLQEEQRQLWAAKQQQQQVGRAKSQQVWGLPEGRHALWGQLNRREGSGSASTQLFSQGGQEPAVGELVGCARSSEAIGDN